MVQYLNHEEISFVAGRVFKHDGVQFYPGDPVEDARSWGNLESAVRSRYLVAVTEDLGVIPHRLRGEVKEYNAAMVRLRAAQYVDAPREVAAPPEPTPEWPGDHKIAEILEHLAIHPEETEAVLEREREGKNRVRLVTELEERLTAPEETVDV